jgi:hypothetical protein
LRKYLVIKKIINIFAKNLKGTVAQLVEHKNIMAL